MTAAFYCTTDYVNSHSLSKVSGNAQPDVNDEADARFVAMMPDTEYVRRLAYRSSLIYPLKKSLRHLDGRFVTDGDRAAAR